jgi:hypothetical protein
LEAEAEDRLLALSLSMVARAPWIQGGTGGSILAWSGVMGLSSWVRMVDHPLSAFVERQRRIRGGGKVIFFFFLDTARTEMWMLPLTVEGLGALLTIWFDTTASIDILGWRTWFDEGGR